MAWIVNIGDKCPVPDGTLVEVEILGGDNETTNKPELYQWHMVARYKVLDAEKLSDMARNHVMSRGGSTGNGAWALMLQMADMIDHQQLRISRMETYINKKIEEGK